MAFFNKSSWGENKVKSGLSKCGQCGLSKHCFSPKMEVVGSGKRKILFVVDAPSENDDREGKPLTGEGGKILKQAMDGIGEELEDCWVVHAVICKPVQDTIEEYHIESCRPNLFKTIEKLQPKVIIPLGTTAVQSLMRTEWGEKPGNIGRWSGWTIPSGMHKVWICPTHSPDYVLRMGSDALLIRMLQENIQKAFSLEKKKLDAPLLKDLESQIEIITKPRLARLRMKELAEKKGILAFDYETTGLKPDNTKQEIVSCSFCLDGDDTFACMIDKPMHRTLSKVLQSERLKKIASNAKFEERWTMAKLGHKVEKWWWDTMFAAHRIDNRPKITSMKFLSYVLLGIGDYDSHIKPYLQSRGTTEFNRIKKLDPKELLLYNGLDSLLEYIVAMKQRELLGW